MGVTVSRGTMPGGCTPICNDCGICLCWDISDEEYEEDRLFWDSWICKECNHGIPMNRKDFASKNIKIEPPEQVQDRPQTPKNADEDIWAWLDH